MPETQNYRNHTRWFPLQHFILTPILLFNFVYQGVRLYQTPNWDQAVSLLLAFAFIALAIAARMQALRAQDRVIRLEERLRMKELLPPELYARARQLRTSQLIALRFASDEELPALVERTLAGEFQSTKEIKLAVENWRGDYLRV